MSVVYKVSSVLFLVLLSYSNHTFALEALGLLREDGSKLQYYLKKNTPNHDDLLILVQGSDCNSVTQNARINQELPKILPNADVLTVEKYGIDASLRLSEEIERADCPKAYIDNDSPEQRVSDYLQVLAHVEAGQHYDRVMIVGGSEGGLIANMLTANTDRISYTVSINSGGRKFIDDVIHSIRVNASSEEVFEQESQGFMGFYNHLLDSEPFELDMSNHGYKWWRGVFSVDQVEVIKQINTPVLLIQAGQDESVSVDSAIEMAEDIASSNPNIEFKLYGDLNRGLKRSTGDDALSLVIEDIQIWLKKQS
jgi:dienelactone hydrolase